MRKSAQEVDLDEAPLTAPVPMTDAQAQSLARKVFGARAHRVQRRVGETWEHAVHAALEAAGR